MKKITKNKEELYKEAVEIIKKSVNKILEEKDDVVLAIPGGRNVSVIFEILKNEELPWSKIHIFMVDERLVPIDDDLSNYKLAKEGFIDYFVEKGLLHIDNVHPFVYDESADDLGIRKYEEDLLELGGKYDIVLLSAGEDGHIGGLYPNHPSVTDNSEYFLTMDDSPKEPPNRMTLSKELLLKSSVVVLMFVGEAKKEALEKFMEEGPVEECPARLVKEIEDSYVLTDLEL